MKSGKQKYIEELIHETDGEKWFATFKTPIFSADGQIAGTTGLSQDITERLETERRVINAIIETEEKERMRLAADLHDEIGPLLSSIKMYLSTLTTNKDSKKFEYILSQLNTLTRSAIDNTKSISNAISPHLLTNHGLQAAITSVVMNIKDLIRTDLHSSLGETRFSSNIEIIYYRIINELINNTIKHAKASLIKIDISLDGAILRLKYSDNGIGFDPEKSMSIKNKKGMGMYNLLSRIKTINGEYTLDSSKGKGFRFELWCNVR